MDELLKLKEPTWALPKDVNSQKTKLLELDEDEKEDLWILWFDHKDNLKLYRKQLSVFNILCSQIQSFILCSYFVYTFKYDTTYDVLVLLKKRVTLTNKAQKMHLATQYVKLKKVPRNQNFEIWLQEWEKVYTKCVELKLSKIKGNWLVKDFAYAVELILPSWLEY